MANAILDILGPTVELLTSPEDPEAAYCLMIGTMPPGLFAPLHSHPDPESFYVLSGSVQFLSWREDGFEWIEVKPGGFLHVRGNVRHAFHNIGNEPVVQLIATTPRLGRFFREIGRPVGPGAAAGPPTHEELRRFAEAAARYGHWLGSPEENAAVGLPLLG